jgi:hypothetical protein
VALVPDVLTDKLLREAERDFADVPALAPVFAQHHALLAEMT